MNTSTKDDSLNAFNQKLSRTYTDFCNALEDIRRITPSAEQYLFEEKSAQIDNLFQSIIQTARPHLNRYYQEG